MIRDRANKKTRERHLDKCREYQRSYDKLPKRRKQKLANNAKRCSDKIQATPKWADLKAIKDLYINCPEGYHVDHIYPLNSKFCCGLHVLNNLQYLPAKENLKKSNKIIEGGNFAKNCTSPNT